MLLLALSSLRAALQQAGGPFDHSPAGRTGTTSKGRRTCGEGSDSPPPVTAGDLPEAPARSSPTIPGETPGPPSSGGWTSPGYPPGVPWPCSRSPSQGPLYSGGAQWTRRQGPLHSDGVQWTLLKPRPEDLSRPSGRQRLCPASRTPRVGPGPTRHVLVTLNPRGFKAPLGLGRFPSRPPYFSRHQIAVRAIWLLEGRHSPASWAMPWRGPLAPSHWTLAPGESPAAPSPASRKRLAHLQPSSGGPELAQGPALASPSQVVVGVPNPSSHVLVGVPNPSSQVVTDGSPTRPLSARSAARLGRHGRTGDRPAGRGLAPLPDPPEGGQQADLLRITSSNQSDYTSARVEDAPATCSKLQVAGPPLTLKTKDLIRPREVTNRARVEDGAGRKRPAPPLTLSFCRHGQQAGRSQRIASDPRAPGPWPGTRAALGRVVARLTPGQSCVKQRSPAVPLGWSRLWPWRTSRHAQNRPSRSL